MAEENEKVPELLEKLADELRENPSGVIYIDSPADLADFYGAGPQDLEECAAFAAAHPEVSLSFELPAPGEPGADYVAAAYPGLVDALADLDGVPRPDLEASRAAEREWLVEPLSEVGDDEARLSARGEQLAAAMGAIDRMTQLLDAVWACRITESGPRAAGEPEWAVYGGTAWEPSLSDFIERNASVHSGVDIAARGDAQIEIAAHGPIRGGENGPAELATLIEMRMCDFGTAWDLTEDEDGPEPERIAAAFSDAGSLRPASPAQAAARGAVLEASGAPSFGGIALVREPISGRPPRAAAEDAATPRADRASSADAHSPATSAERSHERGRGGK